MVTRKDELAKLYRDYNEISKIIIDLTGIILNDKLIDNKYKDLLCCFDNVSLPEIHHSISKSLLGHMGLVENISPMYIDFEKLSYVYLYSGALLKYDLHEDEYVDKYVESQTNTILLLDNKANILNTIKDYDCINDDEYHKLANCIGNLINNAIDTGEILKDIIEHSKKEEER